MQKILIIGPCGAGKTTLAKEIAAFLHLELIHLDAYYWKPGWVESTKEEWHQTVNTLIQQDTWVMDGNYQGTLPQRLQAADAVIFLDLSRWRCLWRVMKRLMRYGGRTRPDMVHGCPERLNWEFLRYVWNFPERHRPILVELLDQVPDEKLLIVLRSPHAVTEFLNQLQKERD
ncbi:MAG: DNA topology modulation protein [Cyanobacteria bacterium P01_A01_bin.37]